MFMKERTDFGSAGQMDIQHILKRAEFELGNAGFVTSRLDAEVLLAHCLKADRYTLYAHPGKIPSAADLQQFQNRLARRLAGEPVAYITGQKEFWSLPFEVNRKVLIPRPDTEILVEAVLTACLNVDDDRLSILEIGTGSGAISVALASELENAHFIATDVSPDALSVASKNAVNNGVDQRISFQCGSLFEPVSEKFDIIVSNPPYISEEEFRVLPPGVREFEPALALLAGREGTEFHRDIVREGVFYLKDGGRLFLEIGADQRNAIEEIVKETALYVDEAFIRDYAGMDRVFTARKKGCNSSG